MKPTTMPLAIAALMVAFASPAHAQQQKPDGDELAKRFAAADKDGDGRLTLEEATAGMPRVARNFDKIDKDKKGYVTLDQLKAMKPTR